VEEALAESDLELGARSAEAPSDEEPGGGLLGGPAEPSVLEAPSAGSSACLEPVCYSHVDADVWREELERVKPLLRVVIDTRGADSGWRCAVGAARRLCREVGELSLPALIPERARTCCRQWREELARLQSQEDRLNSQFREATAKLAQLRDDSASERERLAALQGSVTELSERHASLVQEVERVKAETSSQSDANLDTEQMPRIRKALQQLRAEQQQLDVRVRVLQSELLTRRGCK